MTYYIIKEDGIGNLQEVIVISNSFKSFFPKIIGAANHTAVFVSSLIALVAFIVRETVPGIIYIMVSVFFWLVVAYGGILLVLFANISDKQHGTAHALGIIAWLALGGLLYAKVLAVFVTPFLTASFTAIFIFAWLYHANGIVKIYAKKRTGEAVLLTANWLIIGWIVILPAITIVASSK